MSREDYTFIRSKKLADLIHLPAHMVIEWLENQHQAMDEAVAKACYQELARG